MADFEKAITKTLIHEGGATLTNDPDDRGGMTKFGISKRAHPEVDIANLSEEEAKAIYKRKYWDRLLGDKIASQVIAENLFDTAVNMGVRTASRLAQMAAGLEGKSADGVIGPKSLRTINLTPETPFLAYYALAKIARYVNIVKKNRRQGKYLLGWISRTLGEMS